MEKQRAVKTHALESLLRNVTCIC